MRNIKRPKFKQQLLLTIAFTAFFFVSLFTNAKALDLYFAKNDSKGDVEKFGVLPSLLIEARKGITGFSEKIVIEEIVEEEPEVLPEEVVYEKQVLDIDFEYLIENETNDKIKSMHQYFKNEPATLKNEYTGMFEGKNLIYIMAESFDGYMVSKELTPTLYKMIHNGFYFENYYTPTNLSTIGGEFALLTGLYQHIGELSNTWRTGKNEYPLGIGNVFSDLGYSVQAYHNGKYLFQDRNVYLKSIGLGDYTACQGGLEAKGVGCKVFPESDDVMFEKTIGDYVNDEKFMTYYATISGHMRWDFSTDIMSIKHKDEVSDMDKSSVVKAYIAANLDLEHGLTTLLNKLDEAGRLNDTVIVMAADHHPYGFANYEGYSELELMNELAGKELDANFEIYRNNLIIYNPEIENTTISKVCNTIDVLPTVYNLFGIEYDSRLFTGKDILSTSPGLVLFANDDWMSDSGRYIAAKEKFIPASSDIDIAYMDGYISRMTKTAENRRLMAKYIMSNNYYKRIIN